MGSPKVGISPAGAVRVWAPVSGQVLFLNPAAPGPGLSNGLFPSLGA